MKKILTFQRLNKYKNINENVGIKLSPKEEGYLFGLFEGDGYKLYDKKSRHYQVEFYLNSINDTDIINNLIKLLKKIGLNPLQYQDKRKNCKRVRIYSKEIFNIINKKINLRDKDEEFKLGFVSGLIDSEGYVNNKKYYIMITNTNKKILKRCKEFLDSVGINSNISLRKPNIKDKVKSYRMYISVKFKRLNHISIKAGERLQRSFQV